MCLTLPRPLHHCCCRAGEGGQGEAQVPRPAAAGSAPSPPLSSAPARTALACACDEGAGDGERLLSHRRRHNPPQSRRCEKAPRRCAAPPLLQQTGGRVGTKMNDARLRARSVLGEGRCANKRRRPLGLLASMLRLWKLTRHAGACLQAGLVFAKSAARQRPYLYRVTGPLGCVFLPRDRTKL